MKALEICNCCGGRQSSDWHPGDLCQHCGKPVREELECAWCLSLVPSAKFCRSCGFEHTEPKDFFAARFLKADGVDKLELTSRVRGLSEDIKDHYHQLYANQQSVLLQRIKPIEILEKYSFYKYYSNDLYRDLKGGIPYSDESLKNLEKFVDESDIGDNFESFLRNFEIGNERMIQSMSAIACISRATHPQFIKDVPGIIFWIIDQLRFANFEQRIEYYFALTHWHCWSLGHGFFGYVKDFHLNYIVEVLIEDFHRDNLLNDEMFVVSSILMELRNFSKMIPDSDINKAIVFIKDEIVVANPEKKLIGGLAIKDSGILSEFLNPMEDSWKNQTIISHLAYFCDGEIAKFIPKMGRDVYYSMLTSIENQNHRGDLKLVKPIIDKFETLGDPELFKLVSKVLVKFKVEQEEFNRLVEWVDRNKQADVAQELLYYGEHIDYTQILKVLDGVFESEQAWIKNINRGLSEKIEAWTFRKCTKTIIERLKVDNYEYLTEFCECALKQLEIFRGMHKPLDLNGTFLGQFVHFALEKKLNFEKLNELIYRIIFVEEFSDIVEHYIRFPKDYASLMNKLQESKNYSVELLYKTKVLNEQNIQLLWDSSPIILNKNNEKTAIKVLESFFLARNIFDHFLVYFSENFSPTETADILSLQFQLDHQKSQYYFGVILKRWALFGDSKVAELLTILFKRYYSYSGLSQLMRDATSWKLFADPSWWECFSKTLKGKSDLDCFSKWILESFLPGKVEKLAFEDRKSLCAVLVECCTNFKNEDFEMSLRIAGILADTFVDKNLVENLLLSVNQRDLNSDETSALEYFLSGYKDIFWKNACVEYILWLEKIASTIDIEESMVWEALQGVVPTCAYPLNQMNPNPAASLLFNDTVFFKNALSLSDFCELANLIVNNGQPEAIAKVLYAICKRPLGNPRGYIDDYDLLDKKLSQWMDSQNEKVFVKDSNAYLFLSRIFEDSDVIQEILDDKNYMITITKCLMCLIGKKIEILSEWEEIWVKAIGDHEYYKEDIIQEFKKIEHEVHENTNSPLIEYFLDEQNKNEKEVDVNFKANEQTDFIDPVLGIYSQDEIIAAPQEYQDFMIKFSNDFSTEKSKYQLYKMKADIAKKYRGEEGEIKIWENYFMISEPIGAEMQNPCILEGFKRAMLKKSGFNEV